MGVQPGSSTKFWEVICFNWKILKAIELSPKIFGIFWDVWYETTWFIFFCIEPTQLNQDTVYGKRDGAVTGLALIYNQKGEPFQADPGLEDRGGPQCFHAATQWNVETTMCILAKHYGIPFNSCKGRTSITETFFGSPKPPKYFEHIPCSTCQHWLPQASPTKSQLPHLGRVFTDIQEMKQVSRHRWMVLPHKIPTTNPGLPWNNSWLMTRLNWSWLYLWSTSSSNPQNLSTWWTDLSLPIIYWSSPFECEVSGGTDFVKKTIAAFTYPTCKHTILVDCHGYDGCPALAALEETVSLAWTFLTNVHLCNIWVGLEQITNQWIFIIFHSPSNVFIPETSHDIPCA